jgi:hypothetical protein
LADISSLGNQSENHLPPAIRQNATNLEMFVFKRPSGTSLTRGWKHFAFSFMAYLTQHR